MTKGLVPWACALGIAGTLSSCTWATVSGGYAFACEPDGGCVGARVCKFVELGEGQKACVPPSKKPSSDGGQLDADGGILISNDSGITVVDDGGASPRDAGGTEPDAGMPPAYDGGCGTLSWDFDGGVAVRGYPPKFENYNVMFATSDVFRGDLGGIDGANSICQAAAADAGFWSPQTVIAIISPILAGGSYRIRIDAGFVRPDGLPIAPNFASMVERGLWYPAEVDQHGMRLSQAGTPRADFWMGVAQETSPPKAPAPGPDCAGWHFGSSGPATGRTANPFGTSQVWLDTDRAVLDSCGGTMTQNHLLCAQTAGVCAPPNPKKPDNARLAFPSGNVTPNMADSACDSYNASLGVVSKPLLAHAGKSAMDGLGVARDGGGPGPLNAVAGPWVRLDGVVVALSAAALAAQGPFAPIDFTPFVDGGYARVPLSVTMRRVWTGAFPFSEPGKTTNTCLNWTAYNQGQFGLVGNALDMLSWWNDASPNNPNPAAECDSTNRVYCFER